VFANAGWPVILHDFPAHALGNGPEFALLVGSRLLDRGNPKKLTTGRLFFFID
jgi:hypothetical protein